MSRPFRTASDTPEVNKLLGDHTRHTEVVIIRVGGGLGGGGGSNACRERGEGGDNSFGAESEPGTKQANRATPRIASLC